MAEHADELSAGTTELNSALADARAARDAAEAAFLRVQKLSVPAPTADTESTHGSDTVVSQGGLRPEPPRTRLSQYLFGTVATTLVIAVVVASVVAVTAQRQHREYQVADKTDREAVAFARQTVQILISLNKDDADSQTARLRNSLGGDLAEQFAADTTSISDVIKKSGTVARGTITDAAIEKRTAGGLQILVAGASTVTNSSGAKDQVRSWRLRAQVTTGAGDLKLSNLEFVL